MKSRKSTFYKLVSGNELNILLIEYICYFCISLHKILPSLVFSQQISQSSFLCITKPWMSWIQKCEMSLKLNKEFEFVAFIWEYEGIRILMQLKVMI